MREGGSEAGRRSGVGEDPWQRVGGNTLYRTACIRADAMGYVHTRVHVTGHCLLSYMSHASATHWQSYRADKMEKVVTVA